MNMTKLETIEEFEVLVEKKRVFIYPYVLFKHSTTCPISHGAYTEFQAYCSEERAVPAYYLYVQDARDFSNRVAEQYKA